MLQKVLVVAAYQWRCDSILFILRFFQRLRATLLKVIALTENVIISAILGVIHLSALHWCSPDHLAIIICGAFA